EMRTRPKSLSVVWSAAPGSASPRASRTPPWGLPPASYTGRVAAATRSQKEVDMGFTRTDGGIRWRTWLTVGVALFALGMARRAQAVCGDGILNPSAECDP